MSHYSLTNDKQQTVVYGFDSAVGYFIQVFDPAGQVLLRRESSQDGLTGSELVETALQHGVSLPEDQALRAELDLPLETWSPLLLGQ